MSKKHVSSSGTKIERSQAHRDPPARLLLGGQAHPLGVAFDRAGVGPGHVQLHEVLAHGAASYGAGLPQRNHGNLTI